LAPARRGRVSTEPPWGVERQGYVRVPAVGEAAGTPQSVASAIRDGADARRSVAGGTARMPVRTLVIAGLVAHDLQTRRDWPAS
jgi:hypothetical protein